MLVKEGSYVHKGQVLFEIDRRIYQADLDATIQNKNAASSRVKAAKIELDKLGSLVANNVISKIQIKTAQNQYHEDIAYLKDA
ncbi:MAG: biotin/lipoyl-binding protein [Solitalea-like symbiont of Acarus siro]